MPHAFSPHGHGRGVGGLRLSTTCSVAALLALTVMMHVTISATMSARCAEGSGAAGAGLPVRPVAGPPSPRTAANRLAAALSGVSLRGVDVTGGAGAAAVALAALPLEQQRLVAAIAAAVLAQSGGTARAGIAGSLLAAGAAAPGGAAVAPPPPPAAAAAHAVIGAPVPTPSEAPHSLAGAVASAVVAEEARLTEAIHAGFTQQTCYLDGDESEICAFELLCYDGTSPVVLVDDPSSDERLLDPANDCMDYRFYEPSTPELSECRSAGTGARRYDPAERPADAKFDWPLQTTRRWWGPSNAHNLFVREVHARRVISPEHAVTHGEPFEHESVAGLTIVRRTVSFERNMSVDWLDDAAGLWLLAFPGQAWLNPFHWFSTVAPLYAARRANATGAFGDHPMDGFMHRVFTPHSATVRQSIMMEPPGVNRLRFQQGGQWALPPMDVVVGAGDGGHELFNATDGQMVDWMTATLRQAAGPNASLFFHELSAAYSPTKLLCARRGAITGAKPRLFSSAADAWIWRARSYVAAGITRQPHGLFAPRTITVLDRAGGHGRGIYNVEAISRAVHATGLPVRFVPSMGDLPWAEQVAVMAGTGILVAPHGAHLANAIYLPARAAIIELFPPLMRKNTYRNIAGLLSIHYTAVLSRKLLPAAAKEYLGVDLMGRPEFAEQCVGINVTTFESLVEPFCNWASKTYPIIVPPRQFHEALRDAVDAIGAFSLRNAEWAAAAAAQGLPPPQSIAFLEGWDEEEPAYPPPPRDAF